MEKEFKRGKITREDLGAAVTALKIGDDGICMLGTLRTLLLRKMRK